MSQHDINLDAIERVAKLEVISDSLRHDVDTHENLLNKLSSQITTLCTEVKQIRNALYVMAAAIAANIPAAQDLLHTIKTILF